MKKSLCRGLIAFTSLAALASCQDYEGGFNLDQIKKASYAKDFEKTFGTPDPNQDWSMATLVKANVNLPGLSGTAKMNICTGDPRNAETRLLAQIMLKDGQGSIDFDAIKGVDNVFVTVEQDGQYKVFSQYALQNGMLNIGEIALTRGGVGNVAPVNDFSSTCPTTLNKDANGKVTVSSISYTTDKIIGATFNNNYKTFDGWVTDIKGGSVNQYTNQTPFTTESVLNWQQKYIDYSEAVLIEGAVDNGNGTITAWGQTKSIEDWKSGVNEYNLGGGPWSGVKVSFRDCKAGDLGALPNGYTDPSTWVLRPDAVPTYELKQPVWQYLKNVEQVPAPAWNRSFGYSLFGPGGFFEESEAYYGTKKQALYQTGDLKKIEEGFVIKSTGGPITLPYIFGCTQFSNQFGYIYWKDGEDPLQQTHYVLMEDARPTSNIYYGTWNDPTNAVGDMALSGWNTGIGGLDSYNSAYANRETNPEMWEKVAGQQIVGTSYRVMYFDADGKGTYNFPSGYNIAFFINKMGSASDLTGHTNHCDKNYNYSLPELNKRLYNYTNLSDPSKATNRHYYSYTDSPTYSDHHNETNGMVDGIVKAISWQQNGNYYLGFGDDSGDHDLNDIVFMVQGNFTTDSGIKLSSVKWHRNIDGTHHTNDDDIFEQSTPKIGENYNQPSSEPKREGYTFQGWSTTPDNSSNDCSKSVSGTATAEGICYYAIWEPEGGETPQTYTVKWHKNYDGSHHTNDDDLHHTDTNVEKGSTPTKPATDPLPQTGKQFLGWAETPEATTALTEEQLAAIVINTDKCFYAVYGNAPTPPGSDPEPISWIFACEDLGGSFDYDFNDVVWEVKYAAGATTAKVKLLAAGGTLPFTLSYNGTTITTKGAEYASTAEVYISQEGSLGYHEFTVPSTWSVEDNKHLFTVAVDVEGTGASTIISAYQKDATKSDKSPQVLLLPGGWQWPAETQNIGDKYPSFKTWVAGNGDFDWSNVK